MSLITEIDILDESKECFLTYAEEVLTDRAIPSAEDGLLSVHRKLLWTMNNVLNMDNAAKFKKSASIVGTTLATSYFHGDSACYGALCKLAQPYLMRYPLIEGDGNLGTQEGNGMEAAARYTNARPSKYADIMMMDYNKNVVPVKETYNNEYMEPVVLPSFFPNALVNGREAIGISMAHNSQPMNLTEVCDGIIAYIKNNDIDVKGLMEYIKGPDYPLANTIINQKDIYEAYRTGRSAKSLKVRGQYTIEGNKIIFNTIPYRTYRNKIKEQINDNIKAFDSILSDFNDESNVGQNRLVFTLKNGISHKTALNKIFGLTDLQTSISFNMNFIVNGTPKLCSLKDLIEAYYTHQVSVLLKATEYDKDKAEKRAHILKGLLIAIDKIDAVIELIKKSDNKDNAVKALINFLKIDDIQANAILDMKLSKLTRIDKEELVNELKEKEEIIAKCIKIITDKEYRDNLLIEKIKYMKDKYGDARRTELIDLIEDKEDKEIANVEPDKCVVILNEDGTVKRISASTFKTQRRNGKGVKTLGDITSAVIRTNTIDSLMVFTNRGKMYRILVDDIPAGTNTTKGTPIKSLIEMDKGEEPTLIYSIYRDTDAKYVLFTTKNGIVKKTALDEYIGVRKKGGIIAINIKDGDELASVDLIKDENIILTTHLGMGIKIKSTDIGLTGRATAGIKGMTLKEDDYVINTLVIRNEKDDIAIFSENGLGKRIKNTELPLQGRAGKGLIIYKPSKSSGDVAATALVNNDDMLLVVGQNSSICINANELPVLGRAPIGNAVIKNTSITGVSKV